MATSISTARHEALLEFSALGQADHLPTGLYVFPSEPTRWNGVLFLHRGYYQGAVLHFTLALPSSYPSSAPLVTFDSPIFHPLVDPSSGRMRLDWRFPNWRPREDCIALVLHAVKGAFKRKALEALREALYRDQTAVFARLASQSALLSASASSLYSPPPARSENALVTPIRFRRLEAGEEERLTEEVERLGRAKVVGSSSEARAN
ncbi:ubiquitin-conjugating enzyme/RWD-like protein [Rhodotorula diobovata]|uniref:Ubiquitin-conjugating enzyme/RWD-like protein n=1 Tax=Rhodotorula diobovata TaxID=5288 RepID=A0A5C5G3Q3_9BASI|nr:ubiquitin-conjugating enzyme/RWD-like protein [Rhodotorula diobovata]